MSDLTARGAAQMSDELVNTLENLGLFFGGATGRLTRDYGELSGDNFQMMTMHADPEKLAKDLASLAEAAARIRLLEQQLSTAREALEPFAREARTWAEDLPDKTPMTISQIGFSGTIAEFTFGDLRRTETVIDSLNAATIRSLGEKE